jgi:hypothetical protein
LGLENWTYFLIAAVVLVALKAIADRTSRKGTKLGGNPFGTASSNREVQDQLDRWKNAEARDITRPQDARTKYCVANIGKTVTINYHRRRRTLTPLRVFTKPEFHKTYMLASEQGEQKTFDIDDMTLTAKQMREVVRQDYRREKEAQAAKAAKRTTASKRPKPAKKDGVIPRDDD